MMNTPRFTGLALLATLLCGPAAAQLAGTTGAGSPEGTPKPLPRVPDIAPAGLPGAGTAPIATGPDIAKPVSGDPTAALFSAVNNGDYNAAADAVGRGANVDAQNDLGETPLDLSIGLNRTQITFLLLAARNEAGGAEPTSGPPVQAATAHKPAPKAVRVSTPPVRMKPPVMGNQTGTPDPNAGFLGFGK